MLLGPFWELPIWQVVALVGCNLLLGIWLGSVLNRCGRGFQLGATLCFSGVQVGACAFDLGRPPSAIAADRMGPRLLSVRRVRR